jgi:hypothetical protein
MRQIKISYCRSYPEDNSSGYPQNKLLIYTSAFQNSQTGNGCGETICWIVLERVYVSQISYSNPVNSAARCSRIRIDLWPRTQHPSVSILQHYVSLLQED